MLLPILQAGDSMGGRGEGSRLLGQNEASMSPRVLLSRILARHAAMLVARMWPPSHLSRARVSLKQITLRQPKSFIYQPTKCTHKIAPVGRCCEYL